MAVLPSRAGNLPEGRASVVATQRGRGAAVEWLTPKQAAALSGYAHGTLANWRSAGDGPPWHRDVRGRPRYKRAELERWLNGSGKRS